MKALVTAAVAALLLAVTSSATAHKRWLLPSDFALSDAEVVVVDFSASNNIFYVDKAMPAAVAKVLAPSGEPVSVEAVHQGQRRGSFEVPVEQPGTYRIYAAGPPVYFVAYQMPGQAKPERVRGDLAALRAKVPAEATNIRFASSQALIETYVSLGENSTPASVAGYTGLSMIPQTHPSELYADEPGVFRFAMNGEPAVGLSVTAIAEGTRYRDDLREISVVTDERGEAVIHWPAPGRYLVEAMVEREQPGAEIATRYFGYFLTLEVLAP
jgi:uncharacterized GH25 family protein